VTAGVGPEGRERRSGARPRRLWEKVRDNVRHLQQRMDREWERLRINESLGRRVSRPVISQDRIVAARGERITPLMVARARESGVLEVLLDAAEPGSEPDTQA
jgi:hypothetical protein